MKEQKRVIQFFILVAVGIILFPPINRYPGHSFLFALPLGSEINLAAILMRLIAVSGIGLLIFFHFKAGEESLFKTPIEYLKRDKPLKEIFSLLVLGFFAFHYLTFNILGPEALKYPMTRTKREITLIEQQLENMGLQDTASNWFFLSLVLFAAFALWSMVATWNVLKQSPPRPLIKYMVYGAITLAGIYTWVMALVVWEWVK